MLSHILQSSRILTYDGEPRITSNGPSYGLPRRTCELSGVIDNFRDIFAGVKGSQGDRQVTRRVLAIVQLRHGGTKDMFEISVGPHLIAPTIELDGCLILI
jgi:hypothetical protein